MDRRDNGVFQTQEIYGFPDISLLMHLLYAIIVSMMIQ